MPPDAPARRIAGAYTVTVRFNAQPDETDLKRRLDMALQDAAVAGGEIWIALDPAGMPVSMEEKLRGGDRKIKGALMVGTLRQRDAELLGEKLAREFPAADIGVFRVPLPARQRRSLAITRRLPPFRAHDPRNA